MAAKKRAVRVDDLYRLTLIGDAQISPDGKRIAYLRRRIDQEKNDYLTTIWLWEDGTNRQYTAGQYDGSPRWSPDGKYLAFLAKRDEDGKARLMLLRADGGEAIPLTEKDWEISSVAWAPDSKRIAFLRRFPSDEFGAPRPDEDDKTAQDKEKDKKKIAPTKVSERLAYKGDGIGFIQDKRNHICVIDTQSKVIKQLTEGDYHEGAPAWSPDGRSIAFASDRDPRWDTRINSQIWEVPAGGGKVRAISSDGTFSTPVYSPDGKQVAFVGELLDRSSTVTGFSRLWVCDRTGKNQKDLTGSSDLEAGGTVISDSKIETPEGFCWNEAGIWFVVSECGASNVYLWNGGFKKMTDGPHDIRDFSVTGRTIAFTSSDATHPAEVWIKRGRAAAEQVSQANDPFLAEVAMVDSEPVQFVGADGDVVSGWVMKPPGLAAGKKAPLILYIHGGPQTAYGHSFFHEMQALTALGYGILLINPHGSSAHGERWVSIIHGAWGEKDFEDFMLATDMAEALPWVDKKRLGVAGGSYGGYMTSWIVGHTNRFKAALIERTLVNMLSFVGTTDVPNWWKYAWKATIDEDPMTLWKMSPIAYLKNIKTPSLIIHSENDHRCPIEQGEQIFTGLRKRGVPARFLRYPEESHGLSRGGKPSRRIERLNEIVRWFGKYLHNPAPKS